MEGKKIWALCFVLCTLFLVLSLIFQVRHPTRETNQARSTKHKVQSKSPKTKLYSNALWLLIVLLLIRILIGGFSSGRCTEL